MAARRPRREPAARADVAPTGRRRTLVLLGVLAFVAFTISVLPASLAGRLIAGQPIEVGSWSGTVWSGTAHSLAVRGQPLGDLHWTLRPSALLRMRAAATIELTRPDGTATAYASVRDPRVVELSDLRFDLPLAAFARSGGSAWSGRARGAFESATLTQGWPTAARGSAEFDGVTMPAPRSTPLGNLQATFPDPRGTAAGGNMTARISGGNPLAIDAALVLSPGRNFEISGTVTGVGALPPGLERALGALGPPDPSGRREFSASGTL